MSLEIREGEQNNSEDEEESQHSLARTQRIKKSPKPIKRPSEPIAFQKRESIFSTLRLSPQFGLFENEVQKQLRLEKFWREEIDTYYKRNIDQHEQQALRSIMEEEVPTLREVIETPEQVLPPGKVPFQQLFRYVQLIRHLRTPSQTVVLVQSGERHFLAIFEGSSLQKMVEVSLEEAFLVNKRQSFVAGLLQRQRQFNQRTGKNESLSEIGIEIAFLLYLMKQNKLRINEEVKKVYERILNEPKEIPRPIQAVQDRYVACLIRKNLRIALQSVEIDLFNYFANLDLLQQHGSIEPDQLRTINDKREFEDYMKKKKCKKTRKNPKTVLKTSCGACLSPHHQQYNPFSYCADCHVRFHKFCYTAFSDGLCEPCSLKKGPVAKGRPVECQLCPNRGLLSLPTRSTRQGIAVHIFCMLINGLWKFQGGSLEFKTSNFVSRESQDDPCSICNSMVYTYRCSRCSNRAHPLCAYLSGWNMALDQEDRVLLECCAVGLDRQKQSHRRKFMLNYKKILYKAERER